MSHIQFELRALEDAVFVAQGAGCDDDYVIGGLAKLWLFCWRRKTEFVTEGQLASLIRKPMTAQLIEFGFLEKVEGGGYRVRGATRYLRVSEARSKGAQITNEKRWGQRQLSDEGAMPERQASDNPANAKGSLAVALPPNIEHRASSSKTTTSKPPPLAVVERREEVEEENQFNPETENGDDPASVTVEWLCPFIASERKSRGLTPERHPPRVREKLLGVVDRCHAIGAPPAAVARSLRAYYADTKLDAADDGWPTAVWVEEAIWVPRLNQRRKQVEPHLRL